MYYENAIFIISVLHEIKVIQIIRKSVTKYNTKTPQKHHKVLQFLHISVAYLVVANEEALHINEKSVVFESNSVALGC